MNWFRFYHAALHDPKVQCLPSPLFRDWVNILCVASEESARGSLPDAEKLSYSLRKTIKSTEKVLRALVEVGLLDEDAGTLTIHNWSLRQPNSDGSRDRMRASRDRHSDALEQNREENRTEQSSDPSDRVPPQAASPPRQRFFDTSSRGKEIGALIDEAKAHGYELDASHVGGILKRYPKGAVWDALLKAQGDKVANYESRMEVILSGNSTSGSRPTGARPGTTTTPADEARARW